MVLVNILVYNYPLGAQSDLVIRMQCEILYITMEKNKNHFFDHQKSAQLVQSFFDGNRLKCSSNTKWNPKIKMFANAFLVKQLILELYPRTIFWVLRRSVVRCLKNMSKSNEDTTHRSFLIISNWAVDIAIPQGRLA